MNEPQLSRRPIPARQTRWAARCAGIFVRLGVRPNTISLASIAFAAGAGLAFTATAHSPQAAPWLFLLAALLIPGRLLCNLFDGMVAVEGGMRSKSGEIYNELPDRFSDALILVGAGYAAPAAAWMPAAGWLAALFAILVAYTRAMGSAASASPQFCGPMAKQQRMALVAVAAVAAAVLHWTESHFPILGWTLLLIAAGALVTILRRAVRIIRELEAS